MLPTTAPSLERTATTERTVTAERTATAERTVGWRGVVATTDQPRAAGHT